MVEREQLIAMVCGVQQGEEDAMARMYETFREDFYYFILKTVNNDRELAEDLTQDTFVEILEKIHALEEPAAFVTWAKQIAYHKCTDHFKKRRELLLDENEDGSSVFDIQEEENAEFIPDEALDNKELKQTIMNMINELPEDQRAALVLRYFNEVSVKEIAQIQSVSEGTVKSRLNYARKSIKQAVEAYEKKNGVKLHCVGVLPLLLWLFREYRVANKLSMAAGTATQSFVLAEESATVAGVVASGAATAASTATTTAATTAVSVAAKTAAGIGIKAVATALSTKIIAGVVAVAVVAGGIAAGVSVAQENKVPEQPTPETAIVHTVEETETTEEVIAEETVEVTKVTEATETTEPTEVTETAEITEATEFAKEPVETTKPTEAPTKAPSEETTKEPAKEPTEEATKEPAKKPTEETTKEPTEETTKEPAEESTEEPEEPSECTTHRWESAGENGEGMILYECMDCSAMKLEYKCTHEMCFPETLTNSDGTSYTRYTCYSCGYTYTSPNTSDQEDSGAEEPAGCEHQWGVDQVRDDGLILYRCELCGAVMESYE